ncbi:MAG: glycosyltransferase family 2 protein [Bacteriovorax sp.]
MRISILIVAKKYTDTDISPKKARQLEMGEGEFEVLLAEGDNPSLQRNELAKVATGEYLLFFDNDSEPDENILSTYRLLLKKFPSAVVFGGPSLLKTEQTSLQLLSKYFFSSILGIGPFRNRYNSLGVTRIANEKELILSNMLIRREYFIESGGFNGDFYPGEENEFMKRDRLKKIIYCPEAKIYRFPRKTLKEFSLQMFSYGIGRAKHLSLSLGDLLFLLPALFSFYLIAIACLIFFRQSQGLILGLLPLLAYLLIIAASSLSKSRIKRPKDFFQAPLFFGIGHFSYGLGILTGLFKYQLLKKYFNKKRKLTYLNIVRIKDFKKSSINLN